MPVKLAFNIWSLAHQKRLSLVLTPAVQNEAQIDLASNLACDLKGSGPNGALAGVHATKANVATCHPNTNGVTRDHIDQGCKHDDEEYRRCSLFHC